MKFLLGAHHPNWLSFSPVPLFVSISTLRKNLWAFGRGEVAHVARTEWGQDSNGFTMLSMHGEWTITPATYAHETTLIRRTLKKMMWASIQDWMCEAVVLKKTGLDIAEHQRRTIRSYFELRELAPDVHWIPVLQGFAVDDYLRHADQYALAGIQLDALPVVGVGSVCRRQGTSEGATIINAIADLGINIHAFGVKTDGLKIYGHRITSADSMAWSKAARDRKLLLPECVGRGHKNCANCYRWARRWRDQIVGPGEQMRFAC